MLGGRWWLDYKMILDSKIRKTRTKAWIYGDGGFAQFLTNFRNEQNIESQQNLHMVGQND